jgi:phosphate transport system protein
VQTGETRRGFHQQLDDIHRDIIRLAAHVTEAIPRATETLLTHDLAQAQQMIDDDDFLDAMSIDIEERCYQAMALQQPMASDLRALVTAVRLVSEIERSGDLMVNVAKASRRLFGAELEPRLSGMLARMGDEAGRLFRLAMDAYAESDAALAAALDDMDDRLDSLHRDYIQALLESYHGTPDVQAAVQLALVGRYYERVGDHAVNIGERVRYMVEGWLPEHTGAARLAARNHEQSHPDEGAR